FTLPTLPWATAYQLVIDTGSPAGTPDSTAPIAAGSRLTVPGLTTLLLRVIRVS
ncbi:MAG: hypothetical protein JO147_13210, partial [Actinobacteria bacterium]|nr:hypothetical protein [Actinomycetota bacterium]